jgi:hypothetical protein
VLFFDRADRDAETFGDFLVGEQFDFAEEQNGTAAGRKFSDGSFQLTQFLTGHHLLNDTRLWRRRGLCVCLLIVERRDLTAFESIDREVASGGVQEGLRIIRRSLSIAWVNADIGVVRDVLRLVRIAQEARQVTSQRSDGCAVKPHEIRLSRLLFSHGNRWHIGSRFHVQRGFTLGRGVQFGRMGFAFVRCDYQANSNR